METIIRKRGPVGAVEAASTIDKLSDASKSVIDSMVADGFTLDQIALAMCDGEVLKSEEIDQETAEEIYHYCRAAGA